MSKNPNVKFKISINGREVKNTLNGIGGEIKKVKKQIKNLTIGTEEYNEKVKELKELEKVYKKMQSDISDTGGALSKLKGHALEVGASLVAAFTVANLIQYFTILSEKVEELKELKHVLSNLTDLEGKALEATTSRVKALADGFEKESQQVTEAANNLSKQMGIDFNKALDLIESGFLRGSDANGDFLDKVREYPALLKEAGLSADKAIILMEQEVKKGIFADKGVDAIKEAGIKLRELSKPTSDALTGIGLDAKKIQEELLQGNKSVFQVIQQVSAQMSILPGQGKAVGTAIADIFGGAGEDAGLKYLTELQYFNLELKDQKTHTDDVVEAKKLELQANESLNNVWIQLTDTSNALNLAKSELKLQLVEMLEKIVKFLGLGEQMDLSLIKLREQVVFWAKIIAVATSAIVSYNTVQKIMTFLKGKDTKQTLLQILAKKAQALATNLLNAATAAYNVVVGILTGNLQRARVAMIAFNAATKLSPIGLLVAAITAAVTAYALFSESTSDAAIKQKALNTLKKKTAELYGEEKSKLDKLLMVAKNEQLTKKQRQEAIEELNKLAPEYLSNLTLENINTAEAAESIKKYTAALKQRIEKKALEQLMDEASKDKLKETNKTVEESVKWYDYLTAAVSSAGNATSFMSTVMGEATDRREDQIRMATTKEAAYVEKYKQLLEEQAAAERKNAEEIKKIERARQNMIDTARKLGIKNIEALQEAQLKAEIAKAIERNNRLAELRRKAAEKARKEAEKKKKKRSNLQRENHFFSIRWLRQRARSL